MRITIMQTCDPTFYYPMLNETAKTVRAYCRLHGLVYEQYVGIKRGSLPWHAAYNRVYMLKEMLDRGVEGWVLYMDADAMIGDFQFKIRDYFTDKAGYGAIFAGYCTPGKSYDINSGGFAINLSHPVGRSIVLDYWQSVQRIPEQSYQDSIFWERDIMEDQYMLFLLLEDYVLRRGLQHSICFEQSNESYVNHGPFVRQRLRSKYPSFESRYEAIKAEVASILESRQAEAQPGAPGIYLTASHPRLHTSSGEKRFGAISTIAGAGGMLVYGPYLDLGAGRYVARALGSLEVGSPEPAMLHGDIASGLGAVIWGEGEASFIENRSGTLFELPFELTHDVTDLEFRINAGPGSNIRIDAVQFICLS